MAKIGEKAPETGPGAEGDGFCFYGDKPSDWIEGASDGHGFSVQFTEIPSNDALAAIAALYESSLSTGVARPSRQPWLWSDRFAHFEVGERGRVGSSILGPVKAFLRHAHRIAPIVDVVYLNARENAEASDPSRSPEPGPAGWQYLGVYARAVDPSLPPLAPIDAFERVRLRARKDAATRERRSELEGAVEKERIKNAGKGGLRLIPLSEHDDGPPARHWAPSVLSRFVHPRVTAAERYTEEGLAIGDHLVDEVWPFPLAWVVTRPAWQFDGLAYLTGTERRVVELPDSLPEPCCVDVHTTGRRVLVGAEDRVCEVDLETGAITAHPTPVPGEPIRSLGYLAGNCIAILTIDRLYALATTGEGDPVLDWLDLTEDHIRVFLGGSVVVTSTHGGKPSFFGFVRGRLSRIGRTNVRVDAFVQHEGEIYAGVRTVDDLWFRIEGLQEAVAALDRKRSRRHKPKGFLISRRLLTSLPEDLRGSAMDGAPSDHERSWKRRVADRFPEWDGGVVPAPAAIGDDGRVVAAVLRDGRVALSRSPGMREEVSGLEDGVAVRQIAFTPSCRFLFISYGQSLVRVDITESSPPESIRLARGEGHLVTPLDRDKVLAFFVTGVCLIHRTAGSWQVEQVRKFPTSQTASPSAALRAIFVFDTIRHRVRGFALRGGVLAQVWTTRSKFVRATFVGDRVFLHESYVDPFPAVELLGFAEKIGSVPLPAQAPGRSKPIET